jgi:hypothetical protein
MMNATRKILFAIVGSTLGFGAFAQEATSDAWMNVAGTKSRLEVSQPRYVASPEAHSFDRIMSLKTRAQVHAELLSSKASGEFDKLNGEAHSFDPPAYAIVVAKSVR